MARNRYVKVALFTEEKSNLQDSKVVGQGAYYLLLERPQPKERVKKERKPRAKKSDHSGIVFKNIEVPSA